MRELKPIEREKYTASLQVSLLENLHRRIPQMIFSRRHPCHETLLSYPQSAGVGCPSGCCQPSFLKPLIEISYLKNCKPKINLEKFPIGYVAIPVHVIYAKSNYKKYYVVYLVFGGI
jgi:hypothetical protein